MQPRRKPGQSRGLRKCARDDQVFVAPNPGNHGDAGKFEVGFVDHDHRARAPPSVFAAIPRAIADCRSDYSDWARKNTRGSFAQRREHFVPREITSRRRIAARRFARPPARNRSGTSRRSARRAAPCRFGSTNVLTIRLSASSVPFVSSNSPRLDAEMFRQLCGGRVSCSGYAEIDAALSFASARRTAGEQPIGFSLKSRRSFVGAAFERRIIGAHSLDSAPHRDRRASLAHLDGARVRDPGLPRARIPRPPARGARLPRAKLPAR